MHDRPPGPIRWERHAKPRGGDRWVALLDPVAADRYRRLVAPLVPGIERTLSPRVFANRGATDGRVRAWPSARIAWRRAARLTIADICDAAVIVSDVRDCYGSMGERAVAAVEPGVEVIAFLRQLGEVGVRGLPVGPEPSAILANAILALADREAAAAGCHPIRWVDDVILVAAGRRSVVRAFDAWRRALAELGLEANDGKTRLFRDPVEAASVIVGSRLSGAGRGGRGIIPAP
jgi:hypothetical protein